MRKVTYLVFLLLGMHHLFSQSVLDNNPPSLRWRQINTPHFKVIFPDGFDEQGLRVANTLEHIHGPESRTVGSAPKKISIILQNQSSVSNGFVSILPRRSEFYTMPSQDNKFVGTNDWLDLLASHEYRHVAQYQHAVTGFNKVLFYLFGSSTLAGVAQAAAPAWFWEGDAVATETAFTTSGRGRIPYFDLVFRTNLLEGREFNYHKQYLRSYKNQIPNEYVLGFHMVSYLRKRTNDPDIWGKITGRSWRMPFIPFAFSNAIKKETDLYVTQLYREMAKDFKSQWAVKLANLDVTPFEIVSPRTNAAYTDYLYPQSMSDGSVLVLKRGIGDIEAFVLLKDGNEEEVFTPGIYNDSGMLSANETTLVWNEYGYDPRWRVRTYSLVKAYDLKAERKRVISSNHSRFAGAAISSKEQVVTVETNSEYKTKLVILDYATAETVKEIDNPQNDFYSMPRWSDDGDQIVVLKTNKKGRAICKVDVRSGSVTEIMPFENENKGHPVLYGDYLFYNSPVSGIDNIYVLKLSTGEKFKVTSSRYGAYNPNISKDGKYIYYNDQTRNGLAVVRMPFTPGDWRPYNSEYVAPNFYDHLVEQENEPDLFNTIPRQPYPITRYSKVKNMINPYNWGLNFQTDLTQATVGLTSRDILSTLELSAGYVFDINERTGAWQARASYQGLYPIIDVTVSYADRRVNEGTWYYQKEINNDTAVFSQGLKFDWKETSIESGFRIPLTLTKSRFIGNVSIANYFGYLAVQDFSNTIDNGGRFVPYLLGSKYPFFEYVDKGSLFYNRFNVTAYRLMKQSHRDFNSKWGQELSINLYNTPYGGDYSATQVSFYGTLYFPGFFKHHSLWGYGAYQFTDFPKAADEGEAHYIFRNQIPAPRGLTFFRAENFYSASVNYALPLWYPDIAIGPLLNIQRIRANGFYDYAHGQTNNAYDYAFLENRSRSQDYSSMGIELKANVNILRFYPQFDIGVRLVEGIHPKQFSVQFLIGTLNL